MVRRNKAISPDSLDEILTWFDSDRDVAAGADLQLRIDLTRLFNAGTVFLRQNLRGRNKSKEKHKTNERAMSLNDKVSLKLTLHVLFMTF